MQPAILALGSLPLLLAAQTAGAGPETRVAIAEPAVRETSLSGFTRPRAELRLVAETAGRVREVYYDVGGTIGDDGAFALLDDTFIRLELEEIQVQQERLRTLIDYDGREVERYRELARQKSASASQLDTLEQTLRNNTHELRVLGVKQRVLEERLQRTRVAAPRGWRVTGRAVEPGQLVKDGEVVGQVADFSVLLVPFALTPEQHVALSASGNSMRLRLLDLDREIAARIYRTNPGFDPVTRKIAVELALDGDVDPRRGGLRVQLALALPERTGAVMLPEAAVDESYEEFWVTREGGERVRVMILGRTRGVSGPRVRISAPDIAPGDRFILPDRE